jgi:hypothetical protein
MLAQHGVHGIQVIRPHLNDRPELLREQLGADREHIRRPLRGRAGVFQRQPKPTVLREFNVDAGMAGERHLDRRGEQASVGPIVIRQQLLLPAELLDGVPEIFQIAGMVHIRRLCAHLPGHLRKDGAAQPIPTAAEIDQEEHRLTDRLRHHSGDGGIVAQLRGE